MKYDYLIIIQARLGSTRLPGKALMTVGGIPMVKRVWDAAVGADGCIGGNNKVIVAWPERYPDLDESDVLERFRRISQEFPSKRIIRLTADCPLMTTHDIKCAIFDSGPYSYFNNGIDGHDVQIFDRDYLFDDSVTDREHVIKGKPNTGGDSVNTHEDLCRVRTLVEKLSSAQAAPGRLAEPSQKTS